MCGGERLTYRDLDGRSNALANALVRRGIRRGDRALIYSDNTAESVVAFWGVLKANAVASVVSPLTKPGKLAHLLNDCQAAGLITDVRHMAAFAEAAARAAHLRTVIVSGSVDRELVGGLPGFVGWNEAVAGENFQMLYGYPNSHSEAVLKRVGYKKVAPQLQLTKPIRSGYHLAKRIRFSPLSNVLSKPVDLALKVSSRDFYFQHAQNTEFRLSSSFDERFDRLWMKSMNDFTIIGCRSSDYLRWRFEMAPTGNYRIFTLSDRTTTELDGYIVFSQNENGATISDLFVANMGDNLDILLAGFLAQQREEGADFISLCYAGSPRVTGSLLKFGFSLRGTEGGVHCYTTEDLDISAVTGREENWYLFSGDYDD